MSDIALNDLPHDIIYEIVQYLDPSSIIRWSLTQTSISTTILKITNNYNYWYKIVSTIHDDKLDYIICNSEKNDNVYEYYRKYENLIKVLDIIKDKLSINLSSEIYFNESIICSYPIKVVTNIPELTILPKLQYFGILHGRLCDIPIDIYKFTNLVSLTLFDNLITNIPHQISQLINLRELNLSHNKISCISENIFDLINLTYLSLSHNQIKYISQNIKKLKYLQNLNMIGNWLTSVPVEICELCHLQRLNLEYNNITCIPIEYKKLKNMKYMNIMQNHGCDIPMELKNHFAISRVVLEY